MASSSLFPLLGLQFICFGVLVIFLFFGDNKKVTAGNYYNDDDDDDNKEEAGWASNKVGGHRAMSSRNNFPNNDGCGLRLPRLDNVTTPLGAFMLEPAFSVVEDDEDIDGSLFLSDQEDHRELPRIVGGEKTTADLYPWQVSFRYRGLHFCGGSLIDRRHVLSAAHCFLKKEFKSNFDVYLGKTMRDAGEKGEVKRMALKVFSHQQYNKKLHDNDIAIVRLDKPVEISQTVRTICLPTEDELEMKVDEIVIVSGFGHTQGTGGEDQLKAAEIDYYPREECLNFGPHFVKLLTKNMICAGVLAGGIDSCKGDSGGPLVSARGFGDSTTFYLRGIVSFGWDECGEKGSPGIYTKVSNYLEWISTTIKQS